MEISFCTLHFVDEIKHFGLKIMVNVVDNETQKVVDPHQYGQQALTSPLPPHKIIAPPNVIYEHCLEYIVCIFVSWLKQGDQLCPYTNVRVSSSTWNIMFSTKHNFMLTDRLHGGYMY